MGDSPNTTQDKLTKCTMNYDKARKAVSNIRLEEMRKPITQGLQQRIPRECLKNTKRGHFMRCDTSIDIQTSCFLYRVT